jgi:hypothetical protein
MMLLTVHNLADAYKILPSEVMDRGTTFDLYILDLHSRWVKYQQQREEAHKQGLPVPKKLSQEQMKEMIRKTKEFEVKRAQNGLQKSQ